VWGFPTISLTGRKKPFPKPKARASQSRGRTSRSDAGRYCSEWSCPWSTAYEAVAMMANVTTHKMTKLDRLGVLASEWSAQQRHDTNAVSSKKRTAFGVFMARRCRAVVDKAFCRSLLREFVADEWVFRHWAHARRAEAIANIYKSESPVWGKRGSLVGKRRVGTARFMSRSTGARKGSTDNCGAQVRAPVSPRSAPIHTSRFSGNGINGQAS
jgi:hypothetical protein